MAAVCADSPEGLTQAIVTAASADCSWLGLFYVSGTPSAGTFRTFKYDGNDPATYTQYVWIGQHGAAGQTGRLELAISGSLSIFGPQLTAGWYWIAYVRSGTAHIVYLDGVSVATATQSISAETFTHSFIGTDTVAADWDPVKCAYYREWNVVKSAGDIALEMLSATVVSTSGLQVDTPLNTDRLDDSGNGNDWSDSGGTVTFEGQPPTNAARGGAIETLPLPYFNGGQNVHDAGLNFTVYYKYPASADAMLEVFPWGGGANYLPYIIVYAGDNAVSLTAYLAIENESKPVQIPVFGGDTYWFEISPNDNSSPAVLELTVRLCAPTTFSAGSIFVPDDTAGFPAAVLNPSTGLPSRFVEFPAGESAYVLEDGTILAEDISGGGSVKLYAPGFVFVASLDWDPTGVHEGFISGRGEHFYVGNPTAATSAVMPANSVRLINKDGSFGPTTWTPTNYTTAGVGTEGGAIAVSPDESILYWHTATGTQTLKAWDLVNNVALPDVATGPVGYNQRRQILVLADGTILAVYVSSPNVIIRRYSPAGVVLNTYNFTSILADIGDNQIAIALDDPVSFWFWHKVSLGISQFLQIRTSDGSIISQSDQVPQFEVGAYRAPMTDTPLADCGHSESCPFLILPFGLTDTGELPSTPPGVVGIIGPLVWWHFKRRIVS